MVYINKYLFDDLFLNCIYIRDHMGNDIRHVHVGKAIDKRRNELGLSKSELGRKIGVPQQHVNRILERETMETSRLITVSEALDFNFFSLFCTGQHHIPSYLAAVSLDGNANNPIGVAELELSTEKKEIENLRETIKLLKEQIESLNSQILRLDSNLKDKDIIIELLKERRKE